MPAGRCRSSPRRRAFFVLYLRRQDRFAGGGGEYVFVCPLAGGVLHLAGVHFSFCFSAGKIVSTVTAENMSSCARWPVAFFASPACIFHPVSLPARSFRRWRRRICLRVPAGRCRSSHAGVHFSTISPPARSSRRCRWAICLRMPAGRCRSSPRRRTKGGCREIDSPLCYPNRKVRREADLCEEPKALPKFAECELLFC